MSKSGALPVRLAAYIANTYVPTWDVEIEQTVYGNADTGRFTTYCDGSPDYGEMSQQGKYIPVEFKTILGSTLLPNSALYSYLDEINTDYKTDEIEFSTRGVLALLIDKKITMKTDMNSDVGVAIKQIAAAAGVQCQVDTAGVQVGKILLDDFASMGRTIRAMDYINALANGVGWRTRVKGKTLIVGAPPDNLPVLTKSATLGDITGLKVKHNALHAHNIKVKIVSYIPRKKSKTLGIGQGGVLTVNGYSMDLPASSTPGRATTANPTKPNVIANGAKPVDTDTEEYVFAIPGLTQAEALRRSQLIQEELTRHEFIAEIEFSPTQQDIELLAQNSPEFLLRVADASQRSHNQLYHPRRVTWKWTMEEGLLLSILAVNHTLPQSTGGLANS